MLSLKHSVHVDAVKRPVVNKKIDSLPIEILDLILAYVFAASGDQLSSIVPASLTCHRLRQSSSAILFKKVIFLADKNGLRARSQTALRRLLACPELLRHVRHLSILSPIQHDARPPSDPVAHYQNSEDLLRQAAHQLNGLRQVRLAHLSSLTICFLKGLIDNHELRVTLDVRLSETETCTDACMTDCTSLANTARWPLDISLPAVGRGNTRNAIAHLVGDCRRIVSLNCYRISQFADSLSTQTDVLPDLQELYLTDFSGADLSHFTTTLIPWSNLRKLQLEGSQEIMDLFMPMVERMQSLTHLRLRPYRTTTFHPACPLASRSLMRHGLPFARLPNLRELELFSICNHFPIEELTTPTLRALRIQLPEYPARVEGVESVRSPAEVRWLARNVPYLERLELHIGHLENLWHPTAIPGVDVNVEVYQFLHALTGFKHLRQLRLFPQYVRNTAGTGFVAVRQPLSDEQAIRVFRHLRDQIPTLQILSIAATFEKLWDFSPMAWTVRNAGERAIMTTRQAGKDYEIEQTWIGERRMSMSNRRYTHSKPYLTDFGEWTYPLNFVPSHFALG